MVSFVNVQGADTQEEGCSWNGMGMARFAKCLHRRAENHRKQKTQRVKVIETCTQNNAAHFQRVGHHLSTGDRSEGGHSLVSAATTPEYIKSEGELEQSSWM